MPAAFLSTFIIPITDRKEAQLGSVRGTFFGNEEIQEATCVGETVSGA